MKRACVWLVGLCLCVGALTGCGSSGEEVSDEIGDVKDSQPVDVDRLRTPEGYNDVIAFCDGVNRVYLTSSDALFIVQNDADCGGVTQ